MVLEMRRALEQLKKGEEQGYRKLYDATYEDVYCRSLLVLQNDQQAADFMEAFYTAFLGDVDEAALPVNPEKWFWQRYYREMRKAYHHLLEGQKKGVRCQESTLAAVPAALPLLHRILLVMSYMDDFQAEEIAEIFGLPTDKVETELGKVGSLLPNLTKNQPESAAAYLTDWRVLLLGACRQILSAGQGEWIDRVYAKASKAAGILDEPVKEADDFEYFVADVDVEPAEPKKKKAVPVVEEPEDEEDDESEDEDDDENSYDEDEDDEYDEDDDDEDDDEDDEDDDRYDWDLEDDNRKMVILGIVLALVIVAVIGVGAYFFLNRDKGNTEQPAQTTEEQEDGNAELVIKGDGDSADDSSEAENQQTEETDSSEEETPEEEQPAEEEPAEPETVTMKVNASSVNVRSEASTDSSIVTKVANGETVEVVGDASQEWVQIRCTEQDGKEGYVKSEFLTAAE